jgi:hypothetical protein
MGGRGQGCLPGGDAHELNVMTNRHQSGESGSR